MDEQSQNAYLDLVETLLTCPSGQEVEVLRANQEIIDAHLVRIMAQVAEKFAENGQQDSAIFLQNMAAQIKDFLDSSSNFWENLRHQIKSADLLGDSLTAESENNLLFFIEVLQAISDSDADPQAVYPILQANLDKINYQLVSLVKVWINAAFSEILSEEAEILASAIWNFGNLAQQFPLGSKADNLEIAIAAYEIAMIIFQPETHPNEWAITHMNLGNAYIWRFYGSRAENIEKAITSFFGALTVVNPSSFSKEWATCQINLGRAYANRVKGEKAENLEQAIACYESALQVCTREDFPEQWASLQNSLGNTYTERIKGDKLENIEIAIHSYKSALEVYKPERFPEQWAITLNNLGAAYRDRIRGEKAENLELAIAYYQEALTVRKLYAFPEDWAMTQNNLGNAYWNRIRGDRVANIEQAIACYKAVLEVYTRTAFPQHWATTQNNLGNAYRDRICGDRVANIEQAIACYQAALTVRTRAAFPQDWAMTQNNLGNAYSHRIRGEKAENIEIAIACYQAALAVYTRTAFPQDWAMTQNNLGNAYTHRIQGEKAENLELAIGCYQAALEVYTRTAFPLDWAMTQNNLGNAYNHRIRGSKAENLEQAIDCYQAALEVRTRTAFPEDWAMTQNNLGNAYRDRIWGEKAENLELAIYCYQAALTVRTRTAFPEDWAMTQNNLGNAYSHRIRGEKAENIELAIAYYQAALEVRTRTAFPQDWAMTQNNLGNAYRDRIWGEKAENLELAIACSQAALEVYTPTAFPTECLLTSCNLGDTAFTAGRWQIAIEGYKQAMTAVELLRSWILSDSRRQEIIAQYIGVYTNAVQCCINLGDLRQAIEFVERSRAKRLVDLMASNDLYSDGEIPPELQAYLQQYDELQREIDRLREMLRRQSDSNQGQTKEGAFARDRAAVEATTAEIDALEKQKQQVWEQIRRLDPVLAGQKQIDPLEFYAIQQLIDQPHTAILNFFTTDDDTHIFIIYKDKPPQLHTSYGFGYQSLRYLVVDQWLIPYLARQEDSRWSGKIEGVLQEITAKLHLPTLIANHLDGMEELIIVPHLFWHQIPFAALPLTINSPVSFQSQNPPAETQEQITEVFSRLGGKGSIKTNTASNKALEINSSEYFGDKFRIRYVPSCQILQYCQQRPALTQFEYGTVEDADGTLPGAAFECEQIANLYMIPPHQRLKSPREANVSNFRQLAKQVQVLHLSHHAVSRLDNPLESQLILSDGSITLGQLITPMWGFPNLSDVFLSCCETSLGITSITDDILTLATGFLCAGARTVVSTLWAVEDLATALFSIFYYQNRKYGYSRVEALQFAQFQLRTLSGETFAYDYKKALEIYFTNKVKAALEEAKNNGDNEESKRWYAIAKRIREVKESLGIRSQQEFPFAAPYYWAGFICSGLR